MNFPTYKYETEKYDTGYRLVAGCDEVGRGPLAGPVVAAAVILDPKLIIGKRTKNKWWHRVRDSKTVNEKEREELNLFVQDNCLDFSYAEVSHETIDRINIHQASLLAMEKSVNGLKKNSDFIFIDGRHNLPKIHIRQQTVIAGDMKLLSIACASIIAKVKRDQIMKNFHAQFPLYGFGKHKGYATKFHREALLKYGVTPIHRKTFGIVAQCLKDVSNTTAFGEPDVPFATAKNKL